MNSPISIQRRKRDLTLLAIAGVSFEEPRTGVLAILDVRVESTLEIERAVLLARALNCKLQVIGVAPSSWRAWNRLNRVAADLTDQVRELGLGARACSVEVQPGSVTTVAIANGIPRRPAIVVVGDLACDGANAVAIANAVGSPVFVVRARETSGPIVAATTMNHVRYPVLTAAAALSRALSRRTIFFHSAGAVRKTTRLAEEVASTKRDHLRRLAGWVGAPADGMVVCSPLVADAIIAEATARDADIVSIGSRRRTWFERHRDNLAVDLIDRCARNVLVVPMEQP